MTASAGSTKVIIVSLLANAGIALSKLGAALFTGSASMMAEAIHSFSDCGNQVLLLHGNKVAQQPPSEKHPLGRGKESFFWSFVVALMLFSLGGLFSIYEGVHKLEHLEPLENPIVGVIVLLIATVLEFFSFMTCAKEAKKSNSFKNFPQWIRETTSADILVLFLENLAALAGLTIALVTLGLAWITGDSTWDAIGSIAVGLLLISVAVILAKEVKSLLIGEAPVTNYKDPISAILESEVNGAKLLKIIAIQHGIDCVVMAYKIFIDNKTISAHDMAVLVNNFEAKVKTQFPEIKWQFSEVDITD